MAMLTEARKAELLAYCRIDAPEPGEEALIQTLYDSALSYMLPSPEQSLRRTPRSGGCSTS